VVNRPSVKNFAHRRKAMAVGDDGDRLAADEEVGDEE
jgi:hypothetical protein